MGECHVTMRFEPVYLLSTESSVCLAK